MKQYTNMPLCTFDGGRPLGVSAIAPAVNLIEFSKLLSPEGAEVGG